MFHSEGYSSMVERWSSKSFMWVRFLLLLMTNFFLPPQIQTPPLSNITHIVNSTLNEYLDDEEFLKISEISPLTWPLSPVLTSPIIYPVVLKLPFQVVKSQYQLFLIPSHQSTQTLLLNPTPSLLKMETNIKPHLRFKMTLPSWFFFLTNRPNQTPPDLFLTPLFSRGLISVLEFITKTKTCLRVDFFTRQHLPTAELGKVLFWQSRLFNFQRIFGHTLFLKDSLLAFYHGLKLRDLPMLIRWLRRAFTKINFWRYRSFLYFIRYTFRYVLINLYHSLDVLGIRFRLKGKISVAGNARTRTIEHTIGAIKSTSKQFAVLHEITTVNTFTGVLGLQIWLCFKTPINK